jgi:predicted DNA-binding WGR domain protein
LNKSFKSDDLAVKFLDRTVEEKLKKGYEYAESDVQSIDDCGSDESEK